MKTRTFALLSIALLAALMLTATIPQPTSAATPMPQPNIPQNAVADPSCTPLFNAMYTWMTAKEQWKEHYFRIVATTHSNFQAQVVGYSDGFLKQLSDKVVSGEATSYFNDRKYPNNAPFNLSTTDKLGVFVNTETRTVKFVLKSWGNAEQWLIGLKCQKNVMSGTYGTSNNGGLVHISFHQGAWDIVR